MWLLGLVETESRNKICRYAVNLPSVRMKSLTYCASIAVYGYSSPQVAAQVRGSL